MRRNLTTAGGASHLMVCLGLVALLLMATPAVAFAAGQGRGPDSVDDGGGSAKPGEIVLVGTGRPEIDVPAMNDAFRRGAEQNRTVRLVGHFVVGADCFAARVITFEDTKCPTIRRPVTVVGTGDPTVASPDPATTTIIDGGRDARGLLVVQLDRDAPAGEVNISRLWFLRGHIVQLALIATNPDTTTHLSYSRFTGVDGGPTDVCRFLGCFKFSWSALGQDALPNTQRGVFRADGRLFVDHLFVNSTIDNTTKILLPWQDDNPCGVARWNYSYIQVTDSTFISRGECEFEGGTNPDGVLVFARNHIDMNAAPSPEGQIGAGGFFAVPVHPIALKLAGSIGKLLVLKDNYIKAYGNKAGVCIGASQEQSPAGERTKVIIEGNTCDMKGSGTALLGCTVGGTQLFFRTGALVNAIIKNNVFKGSAQYGVGFYDIKFPVIGVPNCNAHGNLMIGNDMSGFRGTKAALVFSPSTYDNLYVGSSGRGLVIDRGTGNVLRLTDRPRAL